MLNVKTSLGSYTWLIYSGYWIILLAVCSCKSYQANILFTVEEGDMEELSRVAVEINQNYLVSPNDRLRIEIYTNKGEKLVDPDNTLNIEEGTGEDGAFPVYTIRSDGTVELPVVGRVELAGKSLAEVNGFLAEKYKEFYKDPFVLTEYLNKRVIVLGATEGQVIPLENEGMNLLEILALAGGINNNAKGHNIRLIRGDLSNPQVQVIDLSTIEGMARANLEVQPNDIIYVEPVRRPLTEGLRDIVPVLSLLTSVLALIIALSN